MAGTPKAATDGDTYLPFAKRTGKKSTVFFTRDLSGEGLSAIFSKIRHVLTGKVAVKLHTGEKNGPNIIPVPWVETLMRNIPGASIVETNSYYKGDRYTTKQHRETLKVNGWTFAPVDILDEHGTCMLPVTGGKWFTEMSMGKGILSYDSLLALTHFKGHTMGGFGGSNKNLGIGLADGRTGKAMIHTRKGEGQWSISGEEFMERMTESTKAAVDHFAPHIACINVLRNMSVSCDCEGVNAEPVVTPNIGILASLDIAAIDWASVDLVMHLSEKDRTPLATRMRSRHGFRQLSYMNETGLGNDCYELIDIETNKVITPAEAVKDVTPFI
ncbi:MAG: DUF362 domain-containing protein [Desulfovibrio sp.]|nr:DUF362 domain-containing protein [Desulfovibrio sp.]